ncbi:hypothetical protein [Williamsia sp.]|uniref:hypothetical protein n=1 Tax=Williamsia sp. TaxID=1872085 RepID=UPI002F943AC5
MRVELRLEEDEHEWAVTIEADGSVTPDRILHVARTALLDVRRPTTAYHVQERDRAKEVDAESAALATSLQASKDIDQVTENASAAMMAARSHR